MIATVIDTHTLVWYLAGDKRLSDSAMQFIGQIVDDGNQIAVSTISLIEIIYLAEKGRLTADWPQRLFNLFEGSDAPFIKVSVDLDTVKSVASLAGSGIADMPDRIIAATSTHLGVPLVTKDRAIAASAVKTVW
jgi:PIN domain nuclease of toxin-antitoxin system